MPRSIPLRVETSPTVAKRWSPDGLTTCRSFYLAFRLFGCSKMGGGLYFVEDVACHITVTVVWLKRNMRVHSGCSAYSHKREPSRLSESNMTALYEKMCFFFWGGGLSTRALQLTGLWRCLCLGRVSGRSRGGLDLELGRAVGAARGPASPWSRCITTSNIPYLGGPVIPTQGNRHLKNIYLEGRGT